MEGPTLIAGTGTFARKPLNPLPRLGRSRISGRADRLWQEPPARTVLMVANLLGPDARVAHPTTFVGCHVYPVLAGRSSATASPRWIFVALAPTTRQRSRLKRLTAYGSVIVVIAAEPMLGTLELAEHDLLGLSVACAGRAGVQWLLKLDDPIRRGLSIGCDWTAAVRAELEYYLERNPL